MAGAGVGAMGLMLLGPVPSAGAATAQENVSPTTAAPGEILTFSIVCPTASEQANVTRGDLGSPSGVTPLVPTPGGGGGFAGTATAATTPGTYQYTPQCDTGPLDPLTVTVSGTATTPKGGVKTGDGTTSSGSNTGLLAVGGGLLGMVAVGGLVLARRRPGISAS